MIARESNSCEPSGEQLNIHRRSFSSADVAKTTFSKEKHDFTWEPSWPNARGSTRHVKVTHAL